MKTRNEYKALGIVVACLVLAACGSGGSDADNTDPPEPPPTLPSLSIDAATVTEGDAPEVTDLGFTVSLSSAASADVSGDYATGYSASQLHQLFM